MAPSHKKLIDELHCNWKRGGISTDDYIQRAQIIQAQEREANGESETAEVACEIGGSTVTEEERRGEREVSTRT